MWFSTDGLEWKQSKGMTPNGINAATFGELG
jgi:hypothetical protein